MRNVLLILIVATLLNVRGYTQVEAIVEKSFLIVNATTGYSEAQKLAQSASQTLNLEYEPKTECWPDEQHGFDCEWECGCGETHDGYVPRGRTNGNWVSVEHTNAYEEFTNGYYLVVVSNGDKESVADELARTKKHFQDAYIKGATVYVGCMH